MTWTPHFINRLRELYPDLTNREIAKKLRTSENCVRQKAIRLKLRKSKHHNSVGRQQAALATKGQVWTPAQIAWLKTNYPSTGRREICKHLHKSAASIQNMAGKIGLHKNADFQIGYLPGNKPWNTGKKIGSRGRSSETQFKQGITPHNTKHDGAISLRYDSKTGRCYNWIRVKGVWRMLHVYNWEKARGPVPSCHIIVFRDKDTMNCKLSNLEMITHKQNMLRNTIHNYPPEVKKVMRLNAKLKSKITAINESNL